MTPKRRTSFARRPAGTALLVGGRATSRAAWSIGRPSNSAVRRRRRISAASSRHGPLVSIRVKLDRVGRVREHAHRRLEVADLRLQEEPGRAHDDVRDAAPAQPLDDLLAVRMASVQDCDVAPGARLGQRLVGLADALDDGVGLVLLIGGDDDLDRGALITGRQQRLVELQPRVVVDDEPVGGGQDVPDRAAVLEQRDLLDRLCRSSGVPRRRLAEALLEAAEGGIRGAAEAIDRLVVVTHDHDVVGLVRSTADELEDRDLGHVGVLELVDEDVAELALVAEQQVRSLGQQLDGAQHLLAEVERAPLAPAPPGTARTPPPPPGGEGRRTPRRHGGTSPSDPSARSRCSSSSFFQLSA